MVKPIIVIKLGGSALTDKNRIYTPRVPEIHRAAKQIAALKNDISMVIVHGAGSYGHIPVKRWGLAKGLRNRKQLKGLAETKSKLLEWETVLDTTFLRYDVPLVPLLASDFIVTRNGRISSTDLRPLRNWLRIGCIPSIGGDIVPDSKMGFSILSGDQLASYLAIRLNASRLIFATDVDGVFDSNPKLSKNARFLAKLTSASARRLISKARDSDVPDVTGGMAGKIREAVFAASRGIPVYFVNQMKDERLRKAALGKRVVCSEFLPN